MITRAISSRMRTLTGFQSHNRGESMLWLVLLVQRHEDTGQEGVMNFHLCLQFLRVILKERIWINRVISEIMFSVFASRHCTVAR